MNKVTDPVEICEANAMLLLHFRNKLEKIKKIVASHKLTEFADLLIPRVAAAQRSDLEALRNQFAAGEKPGLEASIAPPRRKATRRTRGGSVPV